MSKYCVIGKSLPHTLSPEIHQAFGCDFYGVCELKDFDALMKFVNSHEYDGYNVTIPYKQEIIPLLDEISNEASEIGAVNTVVDECGRLVGYNTDVGGMRYALERAGISVLNKHVLILGSGGTCQTAKYMCSKDGAKDVKVVSRTGEINYDNCYALQNTQIVINTTPVGMMPHAYEKPIQLDKFKNLEGVFDCIYNPLQTMLILDALALKVKCANGLAMLVEQARLAHSLFENAQNQPQKLLEKQQKNAEKTQKNSIKNAKNCAKNAQKTAENLQEFTSNTEKNSVKNGEHYAENDAKNSEKVLENLQFQRKNIVLIGMAGSGKSAIGRALAKELGRAFVDTDLEIEMTIGKSIPQIFEEHGESFFRKIESKVIEDCCSKQGQVVATGGGAVLDGKNAFYMKSNGVCIEIRRDAERLATKGRPLSSDLTKAKALYAERKPIYERLADFAVDNDRNIDFAVEKIISILTKK